MGRPSRIRYAPAMKSFLFVTLLLAAAPYARAADETPAAEAESPAERDRKASAFAEKYKVESKDVQALRDKGLGWGEVDHALAISEKSGKPTSEILKLRDSGMGWGKIAQEYGFKLGDLKSGKDARPDKTDRAEKASKADKADRADKAAARADKAASRAEKADRGSKGHRGH